ncbi:variant SH3 domain-containing protein [Phthorimaea operculella]|nr:variant SH3 domain-containing protein [Phthorimaea operculella]
MGILKQIKKMTTYESPRRYVESDVNIHYRVPVRHDPLPLVPERELARQQAEHMKRLYREQKRNKYLQELQDMQSRRHQDNFLPKEKSILPLNRYDEADRVVARALYAFNGQTNRELSFRKGDLINVRRQIDANWYEGELHGRHGLFPYNYVEILKGDVASSPRKPSVVEGRARAKFDFTAQTSLELPLKKGELVTLTRRIDHNWWEGRRESRTGIFPDSYVTVLQEPSTTKPGMGLSICTSAQTSLELPLKKGELVTLTRRIDHNWWEGRKESRTGIFPDSYVTVLQEPSTSKPGILELPLKKGELVTLTRRIDHNWWEGRRESRTGIFPDSYVTMLQEPSTSKPGMLRLSICTSEQTSLELPLKKGKLVTLTRRIDHNWWEGRKESRTGIFPDSYVIVLQEPSTTKPGM